MKRPLKNNRSYIDEPDNIPQSLQSLRKSKDPFITPPGYFENLSDRVYQRIKEENIGSRSKEQGAIIIKIIGWTTGIAAIIAVSFLIASIIKVNTGKMNDNFIVEASTTQQALDEYILDNTDEETLINYLSEDTEFNPTNSISEIINVDDSIPVRKNKDMKAEEMKLLNDLFNDTTLTDEDILLYLQEENFDPDNY